MDALKEKREGAERELEAAYERPSAAPELYLRTHESAADQESAAAQPPLNELKAAARLRAAPAAQTAESTETQDAITLKLAPEEHDEKMAELLDVLATGGVDKAIAAAESMGNPHLTDDFHRVLVEYLREGHVAPRTPRKKSNMGKALGLTLLEVTLPRHAAHPDKSPSPDPLKLIRDFIAHMESFYRGTVGLGAENYFSFEIANPVGDAYTSIYLAVPSDRAELFEKQLLGLYPAARITERHDDYNIFVSGGGVAASAAVLRDRPIFSLRTFADITSDPLDVLLNTFSKLDVAGEGASVQFVILPYDRKLSGRYRFALEEIRRGKPIRKVTNLRRGLGRIVSEIVTTFVPHKELAPDKRPAADDPRIKAIERKVASPLMHVCIRILASAGTQERARAIVADLQAPFSVLADTSAGTGIEFKPVSKRKMPAFTHAFSYRILDERWALPLTTAELATLAHVPRPEASAAAPDVHQEHSAVGGAPPNLPADGTLLGVNRFRGSETKVYLANADRLRHLYAIGQTGTGKSTFLKNVILQDIENGDGVCFIDPHGSDVFDVLGRIPPERIDDVIYFDPGNTDRPMALNMLEYDPNHPEQKTLVVDELLGIFNKLFDMKVAGGPAFEQYFRNASLLVMESPELGSTLLDIARIFSDDAYRAQKIAACKNPIVVKFWEDIAERATGEQGLQNYAPYITNKFDVFTTNEIMRPIIATQHSSMNFREIMDTKKILLVNLAKGRIGDINGNLLGLIIVGKFLLAALSRVDSVGRDLPPFYLHIDEFQNFSTPSIATILSEARKYKLSLSIAHQFIAQLDEKIRDAVFGNVGSLVAFRVGAQDAEFLEKQFTPTFTAADLLRIDNHNAFARILSRGAPVQPFSIAIEPFQRGNNDNAARLAQLSALLYGRAKSEIETEISARYG